jgi:isoleucyl-tRNA synthetase
MAPFLPFLTEAIYRNLVSGKLPGAPESVHLNPYPQADNSRRIPDLERKMHLIRQTVTMGRALRSRFIIKTRQPLQEFTVIVRDKETLMLLKEMEALIREELNVKNVRFDTEEEVVVSISAKANFKRLGKLYGPKMKDAATEIEKFTPAQIVLLEHGTTIEIVGKPVSFEDIEIRRTRREGIEVETCGELTVALDTTITSELREEGMAREFVNRVQNIRKSTGLNVSDRIEIRCICPESLKSALNRFNEYVCSETLAVGLTYVPDSTESMELIEIDDIKASVSVGRTDR